jgi:hypothetical protein
MPPRKAAEEAVHQSQEEAHKRAVAEGTKRIKFD